MAMLRLTAARTDSGADGYHEDVGARLTKRGGTDEGPGGLARRTGHRQLETKSPYNQGRVAR